MNALEHISYFEKVFLFLGIGLFIILLGGLVYYIIKEKDIKPFLLFFLLPILMIGYPSIQEIRYQDLFIKLRQSQQDLIANPTDSIAREQVAALTDKVLPRAKSAVDLSQISLSKVLLQDAKQAQFYANQALEKQPDLKEAKDLKAVAEIQQTIEKKENAPTEDSQAIKKLDAIKISPQLQQVKPYILKSNEIKSRKMNN